MFGEYLAEHLALELAWLQQCFDSNAAADRSLSLQRVTEFFEWNQEVRGCLLIPRGQREGTPVHLHQHGDCSYNNCDKSVHSCRAQLRHRQQHQNVTIDDGCRNPAQAVERCKVLCTEATCPTAVRQLFHSSTVERANQGCLLEQVRGLCLQSATDATA